MGGERSIVLERPREGGKGGVIVGEAGLGVSKVASEMQGWGVFVVCFWDHLG